ncbi:MAG: hypothetical protein ACNS63_12635 [Candidatus Nitrospinota bacterium M3_3B_026]
MPKPFRWFLLLPALIIAFSCGGGSEEGGGSSPSSLSSSADLISGLGPPTIFSIECMRYKYNADTGVWEAQSGFVRIDTWIYARGSTSTGYTLVNGEVIKSQSLDKDLSSYPSLGMNPRRLGCGEAKSTVESVVGGTLTVTTDGTEAETALTFETYKITSNYYKLVTGSGSYTESIGGYEVNLSLSFTLD